MTHTTRGILTLSACLLASLAHAETTSATREPENMSISISGGVSLGGYESGAIWTWLHYLRARSAGQMPDARGGDRGANLIGLTGASAGGINTLLSALVWCASDEAAGQVEDNLLKGAWSQVGFDGLLPLSSDRAPFYALDGLLTRRGFSSSLEQVQALVDAGTFRPGCEVPMAMTVTRGRPWTNVVGGLSVSNQRFAVPLKLVIDPDGHAWFVNNANATRNEEQIGQFIMLAERSGADEKRVRGRQTGQPPPWVVPADLAVQTMLASSAFPFAFSPVVLPQCIPEEMCPPEDPPPSLKDIEWLSCDGREGCGDFTDLTCDRITTTTAPVSRCASRFVDGGFFDNVPLGVAMAQAEGDQGRGIEDAVPDAIDYVYFDPDVRRLELETAPPVDDDGDRGFNRIFQVLGDVVGTARAYELYATLRFETFGVSPASLMARIGDGLEELSEIVVDAKTEGPELAGPVHACLVAMNPEDLATCPPLPPACEALTRPATVQTSTAVSRDALEGSKARMPPVVLVDRDRRAAACLPPDSKDIEYRLDLLGANLRCRAARDDFDTAAALGQRALATAVVSAIAAVRECLGHTAPEEKGRMALARFDRDLRTARRFLQEPFEFSVERRLLMPTRFAPLAAGQLRNFGAFFDGPLRAYDYWVGVHDGLMNLAQLRCTDRAVAQAKQPSRVEATDCVVTEAGALRVGLIPDISPIGQHMLDQLIMQERIVRARSATPPRPGPCGADGSACDDAPVCAFERAHDQGVCLAHKALTSCEGTEKKTFARGTGTFCPGDFEMDAFVKALRRVGYAPQSNYMKKLLDDPRWWATPSREALERIEDIERSEATRARRRSRQPVAGADPVHEKARQRAAAIQEGRAAGYAAIFAAGGSVLRAGLREHDAFDLEPSTIPDDDGFSFAALLPYRFGFDPLHGGALIGWEPRIAGGRMFEGRLVLDAVRWRDDKAGLRTSFAPMLALRPWESLVFGALGVGPVVERPWGKGGWDLGARAHLDLGLDRVRVSLGTLFTRIADEGQDGREPPVKITLDISLLDLPGMFWLIGQ